MNNEIAIKMINANEPPEIKLNGKGIKGIVSIEYVYETSDCYTEGQHVYHIKYFDKDTMTLRELKTNKLTTNYGS